MKFFKKENNKYFVPVELVKQHAKWLGVSIYEYKLFADQTETKYSKIKFIDINGYAFGIHNPVKLQTIYDKATLQVKTNAVKAVSEIRNVVDGVADLAVDAVSEVKNDVSKTAGIAINILNKIKTVTKEKLQEQKKNSSNTDGN